MNFLSTSQHFAQEFKDLALYFRVFSVWKSFLKVLLVFMLRIREEPILEALIIDLLSEHSVAWDVLDFSKKDILWTRMLLGFLMLISSWFYFLLWILTPEKFYHWSMLSYRCWTLLFSSSLSTSPSFLSKYLSFPSLLSCLPAFILNWFLLLTFSTR